MDDFIITVLVFVLGIMVGIVVNSYAPIPTDKLYQAMEACANNGGLEDISHQRALCKNGVKWDV